MRVDVRKGHVALYGRLDEPGFDKIAAELASIPGVQSANNYTYSTPPKARSFRHLAKLAAVPVVLGLGGIFSGTRALVK